MYATIPEFFIVNFCLTGALTGELLNAFKLFAIALGLLYFFDENFRGLWIAMEVVVECLLDVIHHEAAHCGTFWTHILGAKFGLGLRLENGLFDLDGNRGTDGGADVDGVEVFLVEFFDRLRQGLAEGIEVGAAHSSVLAVDERVVVFPVGVVVSEGDFDVGIFEVNDGIHRFAIELVFEKVAKAVFGFKFLAVENDGETTVQVGVVPEHVFDVVLAEADLAEDFRVRVEAEGSAVFGIFCGDVVLVFAGDLAFRENDGAGDAFAVGLNVEFGGEGVNSFDADPVQADGLFKGFRVVFRASIDFRGAVLELTERDAPSVVAHGDVGAVDGHIDHFSVPHDEFVDGIVDDFLQKNIDTVVGGRPITKLADIHAGAQADVLFPVE